MSMRRCGCGSSAAEARADDALLAGTVYFLGAPVAFALNADIAAVSVLGRDCCFMRLRAFETRHAAHWAALTLAFALAFYAKYTVGLFGALAGRGALVTPAYRGVWTRRRLYLSAAAAAASGRAASDRRAAFGSRRPCDGAAVLDAALEWRLKNIGGGRARLARSISRPAWIWLAVGWWRGEWRWRRPPDAAARFVAAAPRRRALLVVALDPRASDFKYPLALRFAVPVSGLARGGGLRALRARKVRRRRPLDDDRRRGFAAVDAGRRLAALRRLHHPSAPAGADWRRRRRNCRRNGARATPAARPMSWAISGAPMASASRCGRRVRAFI